MGKKMSNLVNKFIELDRKKEEAKKIFKDLKEATQRITIYEQLDIISIKDKDLKQILKTNINKNAKIHALKTNEAVASPLSNVATAQHGLARKIVKSLYAMELGCGNCYAKSGTHSKIKYKINKK